jgi:AAA+ ATPase superfamily predicted ATPase
MKRFFENGRGFEIRSLESKYKSGKFEFAVIYGRRRVGKTSLIQEFISRGDKKTIWFTATEDPDSTNLENFSQSIFATFPDLSSFESFPSWRAAFEYIAKMARVEKLVLVMDEYPYLAKARPGISSELQMQIDHVYEDTDMMLILCGSSMSFMENQVLGHQSPLYGRRTVQYKIKPLDYYDSAEFFGGACLEDKLLGYAVTGGVPLYLNIISEATSVREGIEDAFFSKAGFLYEEPNNLLKQELREPAIYRAIIAAIAGGATRLNEIAAKVKETDSKTAIYIKSLIELGILDKEFSMFAQNDRSSLYRIQDGMYRFWYRFVPKLTSMIESGQEHIYRNKVEQFVPVFMGHVFETVCMQYLTRLAVKEKLPFAFEKIGRWWGSNPMTKKAAEIDIVASSATDNAVIVGECKWLKEEVGMDTYALLRERSALLPIHDVHYFIFSKSGFTEGLKKEAELNNRLTLVGLEDLFTV